MARGRKVFSLKTKAGYKPYCWVCIPSHPQLTQKRNTVFCRGKKIE